MEIGLLHKCCGVKNIRVKDSFFWNEQYLHDNVGCWSNVRIYFLSQIIQKCIMKA
jgi:hypothetical protein